MGRKLEYLVISLVFLIGLGYTTLPTVSQSGNQFATQIDNRFSGLLPISPLLDTGTIIQGNIAGKAGVTTDQIGTTQALAQVNHVICVDGYGAVGDGTTDDAAAIQTAFDAAANSGSIVQFDCTSGQAAKTYFINSTRNGGGGSASGIKAWYSNITIDGNGATLLGGSGVGSAPILTLGSDAAPSPCIESATLYAVTGATIDSSVLTMVTPGQESNFNATAGTNQIYIEGEHTDNNNKGQNLVTAVDSTNHKLYLQYPLARTYTPTPVVGPETGTSGVHTCVSRNITLKNITIKADAAGFTGRGLGLFNTDNLFVENVTMYSANGDSPTDIANFRSTFINDIFSSRCAQPMDLASRGNAHIRVIGGAYSIINNAGAACGGGGSLSVSAIGEGTEDISWIGGIYTNNAGSATDTGIVIGPGAVNPYVEGNLIALSVAASGSVGIGITSGAPIMTNARFIGNDIHMNAGRGINARGSDGTIVQGNKIYATSTSGFLCAYLGNSPVAFTGNECHMNTQTNAIQIANDGAGSTVTGNLIFNAGSSGANSPILVDAASTPSGDSVIMGNVNVNAANYSAANFASIGSGHGNIIATLNSPSTQAVHP